MNTVDWNIWLKKKKEKQFSLTSQLTDIISQTDRQTIKLKKNN
jgi:hypothetical protein